MNNFLIALVIVAVLGGGYYWYTSQRAAPEGVENMMQEPSGAMMDNSTQGGTPQERGGAMMGTVKEFTISGQPFSFAPNTMTVKKGDTVKITFKNVSGTHDLRVDGYNVGTKVIQAGQEETITFVADKAGTFEYYCSVGEHRQKGMKGTLTVQ
ncbi:MAG: cupredoxin domain-containing protein [Patescibacteria group bacterium]